MELIGIIFFGVGLGIVYFARRTHGISGAVLFLLGLLLVAIGIYSIFF